MPNHSQSTEGSSGNSNEVALDPDGALFDISVILNTVSDHKKQASKNRSFFCFFKEDFGIPRIQFLCIALMLLIAGYICYLIGFQKLSLAFISFTLIMYSISLILSLRTSWLEDDPINILIIKSGKERDLLVKLKKRFSDKHLKAVKSRVKTMRRCIAIKSKRMQRFPDILVTGGTLVTVMNQNGFADLLNLPKSWEDIIKNTFFCSITAVGIILKIKESGTQYKLASIREVEYYLATAAGSSSP